MGLAAAPAIIARVATTAEILSRAATRPTWADVSLATLRQNFRTVQKQLLNDGQDDDYGGVLVQGTARNPKEWAIVPARNTEEDAILAAWNRNADSF